MLKKCHRLTPNELSMTFLIREIEIALAFGSIIDPKLNIQDSV